MLSVNRVIKFLWIFSLFIFLGALFYGYYLLPDVVCVKFDAYGMAQEYVPRANAFYFFVTICGVFNLLLVTIERLLMLLPDTLKPIPNKTFWLKDKETKIALNYVISDWFYGFAAILNACLLACFYVFATVNLKTQSNILQFQWLWATIASIILLTIIYFIVRLNISKILIR